MRAGIGGFNALWNLASTVVGKITGTAAKVTVGAVAAGAGITGAAVVDEAVRGADSVTSRAQQNIAEANAAETAAGGMAGFKESIANVLNLLASFMDPTGKFAKTLKSWEASLRENIKRTPSEKTFMQALGDAFGQDTSAIVTYSAAGLIPGVGMTYAAHRMMRGKGTTPDKPDDVSGNGKRTAAIETSEHAAARRAGQLDLFDDAARTATATQRGFFSRMASSVGDYVAQNGRKLGIIGAIAAPIAVFAGSKAFGATNDEAATNAAVAIPFSDAFREANAGNTEAAIRSATVEGAGWAGFAAGATAGAAAGSAFFGVGAIPGALIGGAVGLGTSFLASASVDSLWSYFQAPAPEPTRTAVLENMNSEFEQVASYTPDIENPMLAAGRFDLSGARSRNKREANMTPAIA